MYRARPLTVVLESNIAGGKSTCIDILQQEPSLFCQSEPVALWESLATAEGDTVNLVLAFYKNPRRFCFELQEIVRLTFLEQLETEPPAGRAVEARVLERCIFSSEVFTRAGGHLTPAQEAIFMHWQEFLWRQESLRPDLLIYLEVSPRVCMERVRGRARPGEEKVTWKYLCQLNQQYRRWLRNMSGQGVQIAKVDGDQSKENVAREVQEIIRAVTEAVSSCVGK